MTYGAGSLLTFAFAAINSAIVSVTMGSNKWCLIVIGESLNI